MARSSSTKQAAEPAVTDEFVAAEEVAANKNMNVEAEKLAEKETQTKRQAKEKPLSKEDEIEVIALIANVGYTDKKYGDRYLWENAGDVVSMPFEVVNYMWQGHKEYFKSMWLKPLDARVVKKFNLEHVYRDYDFLMDASNYTRDKVNEICDSIKHTPQSLKFAICNKIKSMVSSGAVSDVVVLREIEKKLNIDLIPLIG